MARAKKQDPIDQTMKLSKEQLLIKRTLDAEVKMLRTQMTLVNVQLEQIIANTPTIKQLIENKNNLSAEVTRKQAELSSLHTRIEEEFGIKLAECSFDDETGIIHILKKPEPSPADEEAEAGPLVPKKRGRRKKA